MFYTKFTIKGFRNSESVCPCAYILPSKGEEIDPKPYNLDLELNFDRMSLKKVDEYEELRAKTLIKAFKSRERIVIPTHKNIKSANLGNPDDLKMTQIGISLYTKKKSDKIS